MDIHHITNKLFSRLLIANYDPDTGIAIALPSREHYWLSKCRDRSFSDAYSLIHLELENIQAYTNVPDEIIEIIESKIKERYLL